MRNIKYYFIALLLTLVNIHVVYADCSDEEINNLKKEIDKIEITYKHLGEVTKENGNKVYNEFMVTAKNIPDNVYVHLFPMTEENFIEEDNELKIKLTTGEWHYSLYSSLCETTIDEIIVKLPTFNIYSLDKLCDGIDGNDFKLCGKYYEFTVSREVFERRVKEYRKNHIISDNEKAIKENIIDKIIVFVKKYYIYILIIVLLIIAIASISAIIKRINKRKIL